jgi:hypothetical protein
MEDIMFYCPYSYNFEDYYRQPTGIAHVRLLHASPNSPAVDVYLNDKRIASNLAYRTFTEYLVVPSGNYNIKVYPAGTKINPIINTTLLIPPETFFTLAVVGNSPNISIYPIPEPPIPLIPGRACVRFVHLAPSAPALDVTHPDGAKIFSNVPYKGYSGYKCLLPGRHSMDVRVAGTNDIALSNPNIKLLPNRLYTIYLVGLSGTTPPLQMLIALDGRTYIGA